MNPPSIIDEVVAAARGCFGLLAKNTNEIRYFDGSLAGVISSVIALLVALGVQTMLGLPVPEGVTPPADVFVLIHLIGVNAAGFLGVYMYLRVRRKPFDMSRYIVAHNWSNLFLLVITLIAVLIAPNEIGSIVLVALTFIFYVRSADFLLGLRNSDFALMAFAQLIAMLGAVITFSIIGAIFPSIGFAIN